MFNVFIDIETLPQEGVLPEYVEQAVQNIKVPSDMTKPKLIKALELGDDAKYTTVAELKEQWVNRFGVEQSVKQGEAEWRKTSFDGAKGSICVICAAIEDQPVEIFSTELMTEQEMLEAFWLWMKSKIGALSWRFVAHNAKFDLPFLFHRCVINSVKPMPYHPHGRNGQHYYCTMETWAGYNNRISMDNLAKALGIHGKGDMDGSKVYDTWKEDPKKVVEYCADDIRMLREIYNRMEFVS